MLCKTTTRGYGTAAVPSPRLPSLVSLRDAHARLMAQRDEVDTAFKRIDAAAAAVPVPRPGQRVPADLAYRTTRRACSILSVLTQ